MADQTPEQIERIRVATNKVNSTKETYDSSVIELSRLYEIAKRDGALWNSVFQCKGYNGKTKNWEILSANECQTSIPTNYSGCGKDQCIRRVGLFNTAYKAWKDYKTIVDNNLTAYNTAKDNLKTEEGLIQGEIKTATDNDPVVVAARAVARSRTVQIAIFGGIALVIIVVVIMVLKR